ncbi:MAG: universal stress protein [Synechococcales bacterium]|nr:universal stress protein [Synechococcales bacterium]
MALFKTDRVLVPVDFSEASFKAQARTLEFVEDASRLHILHVLPTLYPGEPGVVWNTVDNQTRIETINRAFAERFTGPEYKDVHFHVAIGDPSSEIIDYAKSYDINLIVVPSHGRTGLNRFLMGSVAERVVRFAHCPVLVLRLADMAAE